jgi:hypothetical protein
VPAGERNESGEAIGRLAELVAECVGQPLLGHASPRTTRRYDLSRGNLDRSPGYLLAGYIARAR